MSKQKIVSPPFSRHMAFEYGVLQSVGEGVRRLVCNNPNSFTFKGTNIYVVGEGKVAVVDTGPGGGEHVDVLLRELGREVVSDIVVTHTHSDHSGGAKELKAKTGARMHGIPRPTDDPALHAKAPSGNAFITPVDYDRMASEDETIKGNGWTLGAVHTPGHARDHICYHFVEQNVLFTGDHIMGWNTSVIVPPDGHMGSYVKSLERLLQRDEPIYFPGHGGPIENPQRVVKAFIMHRRWRESEIAECLRQGLNSIDQVVPKIYGKLDQHLLGAAAMSVLAQLELMVEKGVVRLEKAGPIDRYQWFAWNGQT